MQTQRSNHTSSNHQTASTVIGCRACVPDRTQDAQRINRIYRTHGTVQLCCTRLCCLLFALSVSLVFTTSTHAQSAANSGQITGQVADANQAAVPNAEVAIRNTETNYTRAVTTDGEGRFTVTLVPLGNYEVTTAVNGFESVRQDVVVTLASSVSIDFQLKVAGVTNTVDVNAESLTVEPTRTSSKSSLTNVQVAGLPSAGRRIQNFVLLTPATQIEPECRGFSIAGQKGLHANVSIDGGDYNSVFGCGLRGRSESAPVFSLEAIQELQVVRNTFSSEFGRSTGGLINISTKSGTNDFHGSALYLFRDKNLTARDAFDRQALARNQQFGGSLSGPIIRDRTFFSIGADFQRANKPVGVIYQVLDSQNLRATTGAQTLLGIAPEGEFTALSDSQSVITRLDHRFNPRHQIFGRFDFVNSRANNNPGATALSTNIGIESTTNRAASNQAILDGRNYTTLAQLTSIINPSAINELRFQYSRESRPRITSGAGPEVTVRNAGQIISVYGPQASGLSFGNLGYASTDSRVQFADNISLVRGAHSAKFGVDMIRTNGELTFNAGANGQYDFGSLTDYLARRPRSYQQFTGSGDLNLSTTEIAFYAQDDWRVRPNITVTPGVRYEAAFHPDYLAATAPQNRAPFATNIPDDKRMLAPRLGIAWDVFSNGKTVIRGGGGLFYARTYLAHFAQGLLFNGGNPELANRVVVTNATALTNAFTSIGINLAAAPLNNLPVFTNEQLFAAFGNPANATGLSVNYFDPNFRNPRALQLKIGVEHELAPGIIAGIEFTNINTTRIARQRDVNLSPPVADATGRFIFINPRPLAPKFNVVQATESSARAVYRGLVTSFNVRRRKYVFDAYYTLSVKRASDDIERAINLIPYDNPFNLDNEYGYSSIDQRHQFIMNGLYRLPFQFEISSTARFISARPVNATTGADLNRDGAFFDRPVINGQVIRRNAFRNKGFSDVSLRLQRDFNLNERARLAFSVEAFNLFNADNVQFGLFGSPNAVYGAGAVVQNGAVVQQPPPANFLQLRDANGKYLQNNVAGDPFQVQLGVRLSF